MGRKEIEQYYKDYQSLNAFLLKAGEMSFAVSSANDFRRTFVLAVASSFEQEVCDIIREMPVRHAGGHPFLVALVETKVIRRQYHTYFDWDRLSANGFFALFGAACRDAFVKKRNEEEAFKQGVDAFLELGQTRNMVVHQNFVGFVVDMSPEDIWSKFQLATTFVDYIKATLLVPA